MNIDVFFGIILHSILVSVTVIADGICDGIIVKQTFCHMSEGLASRVNNRFYRKFVDIGGIPILCPDTVDDVTLATYGYLIRNIFDHLRPDIRFAVRNLNIRISVAGKSQTFCDMPEIRFEELASGKTCWSDKIHGVTYNDVILVLEREGIYACGTDQPGRNNSKTGRVIMHEFSHAINKAVDWGFEDLKMMLDEAYFGALEAGLMDNLKDKTRYHYFTWGFMTYMNANECDRTSISLRNRICTRSELQQNDPKLHQLIEIIFPNFDWTYKCEHVCRPEDINIWNCV